METSQARIHLTINVHGELVADPPLRGEVYEWPFKFETDDDGDLTSWELSWAYVPTETD
jgi:hypothetical protein